MLNEGQIMLNEGQAVTAVVPESATASTGLIESLKNAMQPDVIANKLGVDKNMLVDVTLYGAIGFIMGFLLKKYSEYFISMALLIVGIVVLQQFDYISFSINMPKIHQTFGLEPVAAVSSGYGMLLLEWIKTNVAGSISLTVGFFNLALKLAKKRMDMENNFEVGFLRVLVELKFITAEDAVKLLASYHESDVDQFDEFLLSEGILDTDNLLQALSEYYQVPSFDVNGYFFERHLLHMFPKDMLLRNEIIPMQVDENMMIMVAAKPDNPDLLFEIGENVSYDIRFHVGVARDICDAIEEYYDKADTEVEEDEDIREEQLLRSEFVLIEDEEDSFE